MGNSLGEILQRENDERPALPRRHGRGARPADDLVARRRHRQARDEDPGAEARAGGLGGGLRPHARTLRFTHPFV